METNQDRKGLGRDTMVCGDPESWAFDEGDVVGGGRRIRIGI